MRMMQWRAYRDRAWHRSIRRAFFANRLLRHERLREASRLVWFLRSAHGRWPATKRAAPRSPTNRTYSSAASVGLCNFHREQLGDPPCLLIDTDPPAHNRPRAVMTELTNTKAVAGLREKCISEARRLVVRGTDDAAVDLA
jgi:4-methoxybenzoate monooxygenase (O-demethylating)